MVDIIGRLLEERNCSDTSTCDNDCVYNLSSNKERCDYVSDNTGCHGESLLNYYDMFYCKLQENYVVSCLLAFVGSVYIFYLLGVVVQDHLAPALAKFSKICRCSQNLAGVTLLAAANGANDLATSLIAAFGEEASDVERNPIYLSIGELIGAGLFINMVVTSVITLKSPSDSPIQMPRNTFLKDVCSVMIVLGVLLVFNWHGRIDIWMGCAFLAMYVIYVAVTLIFVGGKKGMHEEEMDARLNKDTEIGDAEISRSAVDTKQDGEEDTTTGLGAAVKRTFGRLYPEDWKECGVTSKILFYVVKLPCILLVRASVPPADENSWDPVMSAINPLFFLPFFYLHFKLSEKSYGGWLIIVLLAAGILYAVVRLVTMKSYSSKAPSSAVVMVHSLLSLAVSIIWVWFLSNFVVDMLGLVGFITELSSAFLGATLLAAGNSVGDLVADISVANLSYMDMAITGTYSSPAFNMMLGFGISIIINCSKSDLGYIPFAFGKAESVVPFTATVFLLAYNVIFLIHTCAAGFSLKRRFAWIGFASYAVFCVLITVIALSILPK